MKTIGIGIIGTGFMGKAHALAYRAVGGHFDLDRLPVLEMVADIHDAACHSAQKRFGFHRRTDDWRALVSDPAVDIVSITTPNTQHKEMALAAIAAGKHVHCEKPLAANASDARAMTEAAEAAGIITQTGFNYIKNPLLVLARDMIRSGEIGEILSFRGIHAEDYMLDPASPWSWRLDPQGGGGAIADLGSHIVCIARFLLGPVAELVAHLETKNAERPAAPGAAMKRKVEVDDQAKLLVRFANGASGTIEASWVATGRKMQLGFEVIGRKGALSFTQERLNELLYWRTGSNPEGPIRIEAGPKHEPYGAFCVAPGHQLGFNDLKTIEVRDFLDAIAGKPVKGPDFREAFEIQKVIDAAIHSSRERRWVEV